MTKKFLFTFSAYIILTACGSAHKENSKLDDISWILGYWEVSSPDGSRITESWIRTNDSMYSGQGKFIDSTGNVLSTEEITIVLRGDELWYIPIVSNQNGGQPVGFKESGNTDSTVSFENTEHDFPNRIVYTQQDSISMLAYIEGDVEGETKRIDFPYTKQ